MVSASGATPTVVRSDDVGTDALLRALPERNLPELDALLKRGLEQGPAILIKRLEAEQSRQAARGARAPMLPQVSAYVSGGMIVEKTDRDAPLMDVDRTIEAVLYNFGISQPVFHWGALSKSYRANKLYAAISARNIDETRRLLAVDLRRRYFDLVISSGSLSLARKSLIDAERDLEFAKKQIADGFAASSESALVDAKIIATKLEILRLENDQALLLRNLARLTGLPADKIVSSVAELPPLPDLDRVLKALSSESESDASLRLQNAEDMVHAERLNYEIARKRLWPKFGLSFSVSQDNRSPDNNILGAKSLITSWNSFATMSWTIFDGLSAQAAKRSALARVRAMEADRDQTERQDADDRRTDVAKLKLIWRQLQEAEKGYNSTRSLVAAIEKDVAAGWAPSSGIAEARRIADAAVQSANTSRAEFYTALAGYFSNRGSDPALR